MRLHINLDDELVRTIDELAGKRGRSAFIREAVAAEAERQRRRSSFWSAFGAVPDFMPGTTAETIADERRRDDEREQRRLAPHWEGRAARHDGAG